MCVAHRPFRDVVVARNALTFAALLLLAALKHCIGHPAHRRAHAPCHRGPGHLNVLAQTRTGALHSVLVVGVVARLANWCYDATSPRNLHVPAHLGFVTYRNPRRSTAPASSRLGPSSHSCRGPFYTLHRPPSRTDPLSTHLSCSVVLLCSAGCIVTATDGAYLA